MVGREERVLRRAGSSYHGQERCTKTKGDQARHWDPRNTMAFGSSTRNRWNHCMTSRGDVSVPSDARAMTLCRPTTSEILGHGAPLGVAGQHLPPGRIGTLRKVDLPAVLEGNGGNI